MSVVCGSRTVPKVSEAHLDARREQIVSAAFGCFARKGFHPTTMQEICAAAELSPGAVYRYFKSKEEIIANACGGSEAYDGAMLVDEAASTLKTGPALEMLASAFFARFDEPEAADYGSAALQLWAEAAVNSSIRGVLNDGTRPLAESFVRFARRAQRNGDFSGDFDPEIIAALFFALYDGFRLRKTFDAGLSAGSYRDLVVALLTGRFWTGGQDMSAPNDDAQQEGGTR